MTPGARVATAIAVLDRVLGGENAERALTNWARGSRYAGSGDRAAVRDLVYAALRCRRSFAALGGAETGRGLMLGAARASGHDLTLLFSGEGHAPSPPGPEETGRAPSGDESMDLPDWLIGRLQGSLGQHLPAIAAAMRRRAPVFLRANLARGTIEAIRTALAADGIAAAPHPLADTALEVTEGARRIQASAAYLDGLVELQDAASQAVVAALPLRDGLRVLDLCAGGGGKTLAMAARAQLELFAHDANAQRMRDLPARAARAGVDVTRIDTPENAAPFDLVLVDAPCSGSGSWRRDPQGKWLLTPERLTQIGALQDDILNRAARLTTPDGILAYATCSLLAEENHARIAAFLARHPAWRRLDERQFTPLDGGDGFYLAQLTAAPFQNKQP